jgi:acetylglutamate kinase
MVKVMKIGGSCFEHGVENVVSVIETLIDDKELIAVHGYGAELARLLRQNGIERETFVSLTGIESHFTNELCAAASVFAAASCRHRLAQGLIDKGRKVYAKAAFIRCFATGRRKKKLRYLDDMKVMRSRNDDFSGSIEGFDFSRLPTDKAEIILLSPIIVDEDFELLVIDADKLAVEIALACGNAHLVLLSDVPGLRVDGRYVKDIGFAELPDLIKTTAGGMQRKLRHIQHALSHGVAQVTLMDGTNSTPAHNNGTTFHATQKHSHRLEHS